MISNTSSVVNVEVPSPTNVWPGGSIHKNTNSTFNNIDNGNILHPMNDGGKRTNDSVLENTNPAFKIEIDFPIYFIKWKNFYFYLIHIYMNFIDLTEISKYKKLFLLISNLKINRNNLFNI